MAHILVADDEPHILKLLGSRLQQAGHRVTLASDGREALARIQEDRPDAVFLDVMMPWMDGFEVLKALRGDAATRELPVIMLTAKTARVDALWGWWGPYEDYLYEPFNPREAMVRLAWILRTGRPAPVVLAVEADSRRAPVYSALSAAGLRAAWAGSEEEALDCIARFRPDLVILDHGLPGAGAKVVLERLKENAGTPTLPVIMLLESGDDASMDRDWAGGLVYWLTKPVSGERLVEGIVQLFTGQEPSALLAGDAEEHATGSNHLYRRR